MAIVRFFANLREAAGISSAELAGSTVGEVLDGAIAAYGADFAAGLAVSKVWVNGTAADRTTAVQATDEIALIPPVSGGTSEIITAESTPALLVVVLGLTLAIANLVSIQALAFAAVGITLAWTWDLGDTVMRTQRTIAIIPTLIAVTITGNATYRWGVIGLGAGIAFGLIVVAAWGVFEARGRDLESLSVGLMASLVAGLACGAVILTRSESTHGVTAFLVIVTIGAVSAWVVQRFFPDLQGVDPNLAGAVGALVGALIVGFVVQSLTPAVTLVAGTAAIAGMFAGRSLGSLLRSGAVAHTVRSPGMLSAVDGAIMAATAFWLGLRLFA